MMIRQVLVHLLNICLIIFIFQEAVAVENGVSFKEETETGRRRGCGSLQHHGTLFLGRTSTHPWLFIKQLLL